MYFLNYPFSDSSTSTSLRFSSETWPMQNILEESEKYPFKIVDASILTISPSRSTVSGEGIPWQTTSLMEVQTLLG